MLRGDSGTCSVGSESRYRRVRIPTMSNREDRLLGHRRGDWMQIQQLRGSCQLNSNLSWLLLNFIGELNNEGRSLQ